HNRVARCLVVGLRKVAQEADGNEVHHDRVDNFMGSEACLEQTWDRAPETTREDCRQNRHRNQKHARKPAEGDSDPGGGKRANVELTLRTDIEKPALIRERHGESRENQGCGVEERVAPVIECEIAERVEESEGTREK